MMELKESEFAPVDFISHMPDNVITQILDRLPLQDAIMTSILSRNWRFKWTMLSQLLFDQRFVMCLFGAKCESKFGRIISSLLMNVRGAITKFVLYIEEERCYSVLDDEDIAHWILFLSRKGLKDLTLLKMHGPQLNLPTHMFSCSELKHLKLFYCHFDPPASFHGLPNLLSLELGLVQFESSTFGKFITQCPVLEVLNMRYWRLFADILYFRHQRDPHEMTYMDIFSVGKVKLVDIAKLANLKTLSLSLCHLDNMMIINYYSIVELTGLLGLLPKLQELDLDFARCKFTDDGAKKRPPTALPYLKVLNLSTIALGNGIMLSCAFDVIRSSPNLQTLKITASDLDADRTPEIYPPDVDYNTVGLLQLQSVVFNYYEGSENEVWLIKYLLACSPFLQKIVISPCSIIMSDEKLKFARKLLKLHRASPIVDIVLV
ncbi:hypothetical protein E3N88_19650 [Mikania micrantha]|uniref:F-box domain-containing protein n=1 Tax=Mikania micrantha TaxID=192012 RepID=A0A5N6NPB2_9ASTR|nr:hypothetical protein E3N88_19650 [Mikania micrantha]